MELWWCPYPKQKMHELKIYRGVLCHDNEEWCKIWRRIDLLVQNWHEEFDKFWPEHSKIPKVCTLIGCFWPKHIMLKLKKVFKSHACLVALKIDAKTDLCFLKIFVYRLENSNFNLKLNWKKNLLIHFENCQDVSYSHK